MYTLELSLVKIGDTLYNKTLDFNNLLNCGFVLVG